MTHAPEWRRGAGLSAELYEEVLSPALDEAQHIGLAARSALPARSTVEAPAITLIAIVHETAVIAATV